MEIKVRKINLLRDVGPLVELMDKEESSKGITKNYMEDIVKQGGGILIAEGHNERIGFVIVKLKGEALKGNILAYIDTIYTIEGRGKKEIEEVLTNAVEEWCRWRRVTLIREE